MDKEIVKEIALANGFKLKEQPDGTLELNPYVYVFADKLVEHQQAKVEELQKQLIDQGQRFNEQSQRVKDLEHKNGELQKRVDKAIEAINEHYDSDGMSGLYFMDLKEILEGEKAIKGEG